MIKNCANSRQIDIQVNDWVDIPPNIIDADPNWGLSFKVSQVPSGEETDISIWVWDVNEDAYVETNLSLALILQNFREVPPEE